MLSSPTCVGFGYGFLTHSLEAFLGSLGSSTSRLRASSSPLGVGGSADLPTDPAYGLAPAHPTAGGKTPSPPSERTREGPLREWTGATSPRFSRIGEGAPDTPKTGVLCQPSSPISERVDSRAVGAYARPPAPRFRRNRRSEDCQRGKRTLPRASVDVSGLVYVTVVRPRPKPSLARSPIPVQESRPGSLSLAGTTPLSRSPLARRAPRGGPPSPADCKKRARVATCSPLRPAESGGNPRDIGTIREQAPAPPRRAIVHPRHGITRPLRTD
jgi:hypothetical protein